MLAARPRFGRGGVQLVAGAVVAIAACSTAQYDYIAPTSIEGRSCVAQCKVSQQQCQNWAALAYQQCLTVYQVSIANYNACRGGSKRSRCITPIPCSGGDAFSCNRGYDACFTACGGEIKVIEPAE